MGVFIGEKIQFKTIFGKDNCYVLLSTYYISGTTNNLFYNDLIESLQHHEIILLLFLLHNEKTCIYSSHLSNP